MTTPPVLFLVFKRPDTTAQVMEAIRQARPPRLYVAADGPRKDRPGETEPCAEARRIATAVDWPCEVKTLFRNRNLGCGISVSEAITWFFENEEEGIILEDDCVPSNSFFRYCAELLDKYREDERVMCISGNNFQGRQVTPYSYYFSRYMHSWGWASWRRAWKLYDFRMSLWPEFRNSGGLRAWSGGDAAFERYWEMIFNDMAEGKIDTWDYQWLFACWSHGGLTCLPEKNLVRNIGFGKDATHTKDKNASGANLPYEELDFPLRHPPVFVRSVEADQYTDQHHFGIPVHMEPSVKSTIKKFIREYSEISPSTRVLYSIIKSLKQSIANKTS